MTQRYTRRLQITSLVASYCYIAFSYAQSPLEQVDREQGNSLNLRSNLPIASAYGAQTLTAFELSANDSNDEDIITEADPANEESILSKKVEAEDSLQSNPRGILSHNPNYFLPISYFSGSNDQTSSPSLGTVDVDPDFRDTEAKFQFSFKATIWDIVPEYKSKLFFGFTATSWWQVYAREASSPFREVNYEPELFWEFPFRLKPTNVEFVTAQLGISHQSNGQDIPFSRSWNRIYASFAWEAGDIIYQFKPWYRIPESEKMSPDQTQGDDNPDIEDYLGHFEFRATLKNHRNEISLGLRNNFQRNENRGAVSIDWILPGGKQSKPYIQIMHGYGDSLIDYNDLITRVSLGILLSGWY